jgi:polyferredoxin
MIFSLQKDDFQYGVKIPWSPAFSTIRMSLVPGEWANPLDGYMSVMVITVMEGALGWYIYTVLCVFVALTHKS